MNTVNNQRTRITHLLIKQSYLQIVSEKHNSHITVKEICEKAQINRSTFYLHFSDSEMILKELEDETIAALQDFMNSVGMIDNNDPQVESTIISYLHYIRKNEEHYRVLLVDNTDPHFRRKLLNVYETLLIPLLRIPISEKRRKPLFRFILNGNLALLCDWICDGFPITEEQLCQMLNAFNRGAIQEACKLDMKK